MIFDIKPHPKSAGSRSELARYLAKSKLDHEREGTSARPLFGERAEDLTYWQAEQLITRGQGVPLKEDVKHMILSFRPRDFELLGDADAERRSQAQEIAGLIVRAIREEAGVSHLEWYGVTHLNEPNPHVHLGLGKNVIDRRTGRPRRLEHISETLLTRNKTDERGEQKVVPGGIARIVASELDRRHRERIRYLQIEERSDSRQEQKKVHLTRQLVTPKTLRERTATAAEHIVGRWLIAEFEAIFALAEAGKAGHGAGEERQQGEINRNERERERRRELKHLRAEVTRLDREHLLRGEGEVLAYLEPDELRRILHSESQKIVVNAFGEAPDGYAEGVQRRRDAFVLGERMKVRAEGDRLTEDIRQLTTHGDKRRWYVRDATHRRARRISEFDVRARAERRALREADEQNFTDSTGRQEFRRMRFEQHLAAHRSTIDEGRRRQAEAVAALEKRLAEAQQKYASLEPLVAEIRERYKANQEPLPVPYASAKEIGELQNQAAKARDAKRIRIFEDIRRHNATEREEAARDSYERGRLSAQKWEAETELAAQQRRSEEFERAHYLSRFDLSGDGSALWSLARVGLERDRVEREFERAGIFGWLPGVRERAASDLSRLNRIEGEIIERIDARRAEMSRERERLTETVAVLSEIREKDNLNGKQEREPDSHVEDPFRVTRDELTRLEAHAYALRDGKLLKRVDDLTRAFEGDAHPSKRRSPEELAARALAREVIAEIDYRDERTRFAEHERWSHFTPLLVRDESGRDRVATPAQTQPRTLGEYLLTPFVEGRERREWRMRVERAAEEAHAQARSRLTPTASYYAAAKEITDNYRALLAAEGKEFPQPEFTPKELNRIDLYATGLRDPKERARYRELLEAAELLQTHGQGARPRRQQELSGDYSPEEHLHPGDELMEREVMTRDHIEHETFGRHSVEHIPERAATPQTAGQPQYTLSPENSIRASTEQPAKLARDMSR